MSRRPPIPAREGISPRKTVLRGVVPDAPEYFAALAGDSPFHEGEKIPAGLELHKLVPAWFHPDVPQEPPIPFDYHVLYQDEHLIVVDKPHFLPTTSNGRLIRETVQTRLRVDFGEDDIVPLHRLDRLTAGIVVCSRNRETRAVYQNLFLRKQVSKRYRAYPVRPYWSSMHELSLPMFKRRGHRQVQVVEADTAPIAHGVVMTTTRVHGQGSYVDLWPETGHTHQLRVVMNYLGHPLIGDDTYPTDRGLDLYDFSQPLGLVHTSCEFRDPVGNHNRKFSSNYGQGSTLE